jgi:hypothetical protein
MMIHPYDGSYGGVKKGKKNDQLPSHASKCMSARSQTKKLSTAWFHLYSFKAGSNNLWQWRPK